MGNEQSCSPQNDIDCYYNNFWKKRNSWINSVNRMDTTSKNLDSNFDLMQYEIDKKLSKFVLENNHQDNFKKFKKSFYKRSKDEVFFKEIFDEIKQIDSFDKFIKLSIKLQKMNIVSLYNIGIANDVTVGKPNIHIISVGEFPLSTKAKEMFEINDLEYLDNYSKTINILQCFCE